jgi:hypothetical protein
MLLTILLFYNLLFAFASPSDSDLTVGIIETTTPTTITTCTVDEFFITVLDLTLPIRSPNVGHLALFADVLEELSEQLQSYAEIFSACVKKEIELRYQIWSDLALREEEYQVNGTADNELSRMSLSPSENEENENKSDEERYEKLLAEASRDLSLAMGLHALLDALILPLGKELALMNNRYKDEIDAIVAFLFDGKSCTQSNTIATRLDIIVQDILTANEKVFVKEDTCEELNAMYGSLAIPNGNRMKTVIRIDEKLQSYFKLKQELLEWGNQLIDRQCDLQAVHQNLDCPSLLIRTGPYHAFAIGDNGEWTQWEKCREVEQAINRVNTDLESVMSRLERIQAIVVSLQQESLLATTFHSVILHEIFVRLLKSIGCDYGIDK